MSLQLALGPLFHYWDKNAVTQFYADIADSAVTIVYLGETVCSRRHALRPADWLDLAQDLARCGKEVVLAGTALLENDSDLSRLRKICEQSVFRVQVDDYAALPYLRDLPWVAGPQLNVYNAQTVAWLAARGAGRVVLPLEVTRHMAQQLVAAQPQLEWELFAWGQPPLAISARCFTARQHRLNKDHCGWRCAEHPDGWPLQTQDGQTLFLLNGVQTLGAASLAYDDPAEWRQAGINILRLSPQRQGMAEVITTYAGLVAGELTPAAARPRLQALASFGLADGYWHNGAGMHLQVAP